MSFRRYPKYKDSGVEWLGEVPEHWGVAPLKTVATHNDEVLNEDTPEDHEIVYVDISGVEAGVGITTKESMAFSAAPSRARRRVRHGDVIVSTVRTYLRAIARVKDPEENLVVSTGFAVIRPRKALLADFAGHMLSANYFIEQVIARSVGVSYPAINASDLVAIPALVPPANEQTAIAAFLDRETGKIDALIAEQRRLIELLQEKRQAVISHAVTKGLNPDAPMKDSGIEWLGTVPAHWEVTRLSRYAAVGNGCTPSKDNQDYWVNGDVPWLSSGEVNQLYITEASEFITAKALAECSVTILPRGTVVVGMIGQGKTRGLSALLKCEATINQNLAGVVPSSRLNSEYLHFVFMAIYEYLREFGRGGNQAALNCDIISATLIPLPPVGEQAEIAARLAVDCDSHDRLIAEAERAITLLQERRSALISAAVTGQIDVRGLAGSEVA